MCNETDTKDALLREPTTGQEHSNVHEEYNFADADVVLSSCDGKQFRVHSCVMKLASRVFRDMLDMPLPAGQISELRSEHWIPLQENAEVLKSLLGLTYPDRPFFEPEELSFNLLQDICIAADKYDMPGAQRILRMVFRLGLHSYPPIGAYILASRFDWEQERKRASSKTLDIDLRSSESRKQLRATSSAAAMDVLELHANRRDVFVGALDTMGWTDNEGKLSVHWDTARSHQCAESPASLGRTCMKIPSWTALIYRVSEKMERCSLGTFLRDEAFWDREEFEEIWNIECSSGNKIICRKGLMSELLRILDNLPNTI